MFDVVTMTGREDGARPPLVAVGRLTAPRIGIVVVAYNAVSTLAQVLDRIPADFRSRIEEVLVCDDASQDSTYLVGLGYKQVVTDLPLTIVRHPRTSATAATRRRRTGSPWSAGSTSSCSSTATASTRRSACPTSSARSSAASATPSSARG